MSALDDPATEAAFLFCAAIDQLSLLSASGLMIGSAGFCDCRKGRSGESASSCLDGGRAARLGKPVC